MSEQVSVTSSAKERCRTKKTDSSKVRKGVFTCKYCTTEFTQKTNLYRHIRHLHKRRADLPLNIKGELIHGKQICGQCKEEFETHSLLSFHRALIHPVRKGKVIITCPLCPFSGSKSELLGHYISKHNVKVEIEEHNFNSPLEFYIWKSNVERDTLTQYAKREKHHVLVSGVIIDSFYCHRDGFYKPEGKNLRNVKVKGTNKINGYCPAFMKVKTNADEHVSVLFLKTHVGHDYDLDRLTLTREERDSIAAKIAIGISLDEILAELHSSKHERLRIMTRKDLYNIEVSYNLKSVRGRPTESNNILEQHNSAVNTPHNFVTVEGDHWNVKSTSEPAAVFKVEILNTNCNLDNCKLKCNLANYCEHNCNCTNQERLATMCEHKQVVHLIRKESEILIQQADCITSNDCTSAGDVLVNDEIASSSVSTIASNTNLETPIMLENCPQLTTLVIEDLPSTLSNETAAMFVPSNVNTRKALIRTQLATILQAVEGSDLEEELHIIHSLLDPIVQTVQTMKTSEGIIIPVWADGIG